MDTYSVRPSEIKRKWFVVDAAGQPLGRLASQVASILMGKNKPIYATNIDTGDFVIVVNSSLVRLTGNKASQKVYYRHSQYPGGLKEIPYDKMLASHPERVVETAVRGMLPHTKLGKAMYRKLKVYAGAEHEHAAQQPEELKI